MKRKNREKMLKDGLNPLLETRLHSMANHLKLLTSREKF